MIKHRAQSLQNNSHVSRISPQESWTRFHPPKLGETAEDARSWHAANCRSSLLYRTVGIPLAAPRGASGGERRSLDRSEFRESLAAARRPRDGNEVSIIRARRSIEADVPALLLPGIRRVTFHPSPGGHNAALISYGAACDTDASRPGYEEAWKWNLKAGWSPPAGEGRVAVNFVTHELTSDLIMRDPFKILASDLDG